jgi:5-methylcytosine-specific restriction endonuclease McrA
MSAWPYNTQRWQRLRAAHLSGEPCCRYCTELGLTTPATVVDHVVPIRERKDLAFDAGNLQSLCESCHNRVKQREESTGERIGCDERGIPFRGWD